MWSLLEPQAVHIRQLRPYGEATMYAMRIRAIALLEKAGKLMYLRPERGWEAALRQKISTASNGSTPANGQTGHSTSPSNGSGSSNNSDALLSTPDSSPSTTAWSWDEMTQLDPAQLLGMPWTRCAQVRTPKAYEDIKQALLRVEEDMPLERRTNWDVWDGQVQLWHFGGAKKEIVTQVSTASPLLGQRRTGKSLSGWLRQEFFAALHVGLRLDVPVRRLGIQCREYFGGQCGPSLGVYRSDDQLGRHCDRDGRVHRHVLDIYRENPHPRSQALALARPGRRCVYFFASYHDT